MQSFFFIQCNLFFRFNLFFDSIFYFWCNLFFRFNIFWFYLIWLNLLFWFNFFATKPFEREIITLDYHHSFKLQWDSFRGLTFTKLTFDPFDIDRILKNKQPNWINSWERKSPPTHFFENWNSKMAGFIWNLSESNGRSFFSHKWAPIFWK